MYISTSRAIVPSNPVIRHAFQSRSLAGLGILPTGLGATSTECEEWRKVAAGYGTHTPDERRLASSRYNTQCRTAPVARPVKPTCLPNTRGQIPPPDCGPLDSACVSCANSMLRYNLDVARANQNRCRRAKCEYNCAVNTAAGQPQNCYDCATQFPDVSPRIPGCATTYGPGYVSPAAVVGSKGVVETGQDGKSYYTGTSGGPRSGDPLTSRPTNIKLLPASPIYQAANQSSIPAPASPPPSSQPGEVAVAGSGVDESSGGGSGGGSGNGGGFLDSLTASTGLSPLLLAALAGGAVFLFTRGK